jgi:hypothetical protein
MLFLRAILRAKLLVVYELLFRKYLYIHSAGHISWPLSEVPAKDSEKQQLWAV